MGDLLDNAYDNEAFQDETDDNEIIILYLGWKRSGKTTIKERVFDGLQQNQINYVELTNDVRVSKVPNSFAKMRIIDYPGSKNFAEEIPDTKWHLPVEKGGLGIGGANANLAVIYVVDAQDQNCYNDTLNRMILYAASLSRHNINLKFEIFLHKVENLNDDEMQSIYEETSSYFEQLKADYEHLVNLNVSIHFTSCMDQTIFDATSKVIQKLIPEQAQLENLLNLMINKASVEKAYLFDVRTKLYIATDSVQPNELTMYEICSGMIEMVDGISNVYEGNRTHVDNGEEPVMPIFDENQESWVTMSNQIIICLYGVTSSLALVCVMREGIQKIRGPTTFNVNLFRKAIRETLQRGRSIPS